IFFIIFIIVFFISFISSMNFQKVDNLYHIGKYQEGVKILEGQFEILNPDPEIIWRITRFYFEIAEALPEKEKQEKIKYYTKGMQVSQPFLDITEGTNLDKAQIIFWYTACYGSRAELIGIKESLDIIPELFSLADKSLALDPTFAAPYLMLGRIDDAVPFFLGGDKFRMGKNLSKAIEFNPNDMSVLVESGELFLKRGWDVGKKEKMKEKNGENDGTPQNLSDKEYAKILLDKSLELFKSINDPSVRDKIKYNQALELLKKFQ
ncbi:MAG: hypothetical protein JXA99_05640, partial [Candidatus Lokiarchaeota archaeon]|nr:hypothetical protein [Candidatus Lokiarchaeota archaeon]